ncbi:MAG: reductive dehalogenase, partial [Pirellulaceae bacterium]
RFLVRPVEHVTDSPLVNDSKATAGDIESETTRGKPEGTSRRGFFGESLVGAIGFKHAIAGGAAVAATGLGVYAAIRSKGIPLDQVPNEMTDDYKPFDNRKCIQTFCISEKLQEQYPERVEAWEARAKRDGKEFTVATSDAIAKQGKIRDEPGYTQLDYALRSGSWLTSQRSGPAAQPDSGARSWDQSDVADEQWQFDSKQEAAAAIKRAAELYGAAACGITPRDKRFDYDPIYDPINDKELTWEDDFPFEPKTVIVCLIEQDYIAMSAAPTAIADATTGQGYSEMDIVAPHLAKFLRRLGYRAVASGNDLGLSTAYAVSAGLGELARAGWMIAAGFGPNVRICKVYTDFEFVEYDPPRDFGITNFCIHCKRCADACPSESITHEDHPSFEATYEGADDPNYEFANQKGVKKWQNDTLKCYEYWVEGGTGCASCVAACPYNKPDFWHHDFVEATNIITPGPLHQFNKEMDKVFGYGSVNDPEKVDRFWKS